MKSTKILLAAGLAIVATGAFAETGVTTYQRDNVANVYGRAGVSNVKIAGPLVSQPGNVADAGRETSRGDTKLSVTANKEVIPFGRS